MSKFYIQSYYQYPVTFSSIGKTIPARSAQGELRNVAEFTEKEIDTLKKREPFFRELVDKKKIRVLDHLPASYVPPAQRINEANDEAEKLRKENEELRAKFATLAALNKGKTMSNEVDIEDQDDGLEGDKAPAEETTSVTRDEVLTAEEVEGKKKTSSSKKGKK